jgi:signal transduction histidine kinase
MPQYLYGDELRVRQIFTNIINNAVKYTPKGRVKVNLRITNSGRILFTVEDSGIGIKQEDIPKLFDNFQRLDSSKNRWKQGLHWAPGFSSRMFILNPISGLGIPLSAVWDCV